MKELIPQYEKVKSYYGKAHTITDKSENETIITLYSYNTPVIILTKTNNSITYKINHDINTKKLYSSTTIRHMKEFLLQNIPLMRLSHYFDTPITKKEVIEKENYNFCNE